MFWSGTVEKWNVQWITESKVENAERERQRARDRDKRQREKHWRSWEGSARRAL